MQTALTSYTFGNLTCRIADAQYRFAGQGCNYACDLIKGDTVFIITLSGLRLEGKLINIDIENNILSLEDGHNILISTIVFIGRID